MGLDPLEDGVRLLAARLAGSPRITVVTGAGVSAASGIPTFRGGRHDSRSRHGQDASYRWPSASIAYDRGSGYRSASRSVPYCRGLAFGGRGGGRLRGAGGLWKSHRPEDLATPEAFDRDPLLVWEWYAWRRELVAQARPNRAHEVLAAWSRRYAGFRLVTQNVDSLHERAGTRNVTRFHGSLRSVACRARCAESAPEGWEHNGAFSEWPPRCPHCGGLARPGVVTAALRAAFPTAEGLPSVVGWVRRTHPTGSPPRGIRGRRVRRLPRRGDFGGRLSGGGSRPRGRLSGRVHGRDQSGRDAGDERSRPRPAGSRRNRARPRRTGPARPGLTRSLDRRSRLTEGE
jgi:hypothetical protein